LGKILLQDKYNIGVLTVNIEFMWRGLETGERRARSLVLHAYKKFQIVWLFNLSTLNVHDEACFRNAWCAL